MEPTEPVDPYGDIEYTLAVTYLPSIDWPDDAGELRFGTTLPHDWIPGEGFSFVQVAVDNATHHAGWGGTSLGQDYLIRVTVWPNTQTGAAYGSPTLAKRIARLVENALLQFPARPVTGVLSTVDEISKTPLATFTVTLGVRPQY